VAELLLVGFAYLSLAASNEIQLPEATTASATENLTAAQLFEAADSAVTQGQYETAITLLTALTNDPNDDYRAEARVRLARIHVALGTLRTAATWYQKVLDEKPNSVAARVELARVLAQLGEEGAAERQLRRAAAAPGLPDDVSRALGRIGAGLRSNAPIGGSFQLGIAPDSNINRATNAQQVDIFGLPFALNEDGQAQSGIGVTVNAGGFVRRKFNANSRLVAQVSIDADLYKKSDFNDISVAANIGPEIRGGRSIFRPSVSAGRRWLGANKLYDFYGISTSLQRSISKTSQIRIVTSVTNFDYPTRADLSGPIYSLALAYEREITPRLSSRVGINAARTDANAPSNASNTVGGDITLSRDAGRFTVFSRIGYSYTKGDAPFVAFATNRRDNLYDAEIGLVFRQISALGLSPLIRVKRTENKSPITIFDFKRTRFEFALTRSF
jgi:outer membrane protein